jgi:UMF1 family MFS transporter
MAAFSSRTWLEALGLGRPELRAWALYDWANSAMVTTIIAAVFPIYYGRVACEGMAPGESTRRFAAITTLGMVIIAILAPVLGAIADARPIKKRLLAAFLALGVASVAGMFFIGPGDWLLASALFVLANIGANGSFVFYDSLLPHVAREDEIDRVSASGYALGYVGGGILLALNLLWIQKPEWFGLPPTTAAEAWQRTLPSRLAFLSVAVWWALFSIPLFVRVPEPKVAAATGSRGSGSLVRTFAEAFRRLAQTFRELRLYRQGFLMLLAFLIYNDGIGTIIRMATKYGEEIGIGQSTMIASLVITQFVGIPFALLFGAAARRVPAKWLILLGLGVYVGISVLGYFMTREAHFLLLAILVATVQGGTQALSRSLFAGMIPRSKSGEFFGFFAVVEKFAGIAGPALFGLTITLTGSMRASILTVIPFFVVGAALLMLMDVNAGRAQARQADSSAGIEEAPARAGDAELDA